MKSSRRSGRGEGTRKVIVVVAVVFPLLILVGLVFWSYSRWDQRQQTQRLAFEQPSDGIRDARINLQNPAVALPRILELFEQRTTEGRGFDQLKSFQAIGRFVVDRESGTELPFMLTKKAPDLVRLRFVNGPIVILRGYDGRVAWAASKRDGRLIEVTERSPAEAVYLLRNATINSYLYQPDRKGWSLHLEGLTDYEGIACYDIRGSHSTEGTIRSLIDAGTFFEIARYSQFETAEGTINEATRMFDYFSVDGFAFPARVESHRDGELEQVQHIDDVEVNIGIFDWFFAMPSDSAPEPATTGR